MLRYTGWWCLVSGFRSDWTRRLEYVIMQSFSKVYTLIVNVNREQLGNLCEIFSNNDILELYLTSMKHSAWSRIWSTWRLKDTLRSPLSGMCAHGSDSRLAMELRFKMCRVRDIHLLMSNSNDVFMSQTPEQQPYDGLDRSRGGFASHAKAVRRRRRMIRVRNAGEETANRAWIWLRRRWEANDLGDGRSQPYYHALS